MTTEKQMMLGRDWHGQVDPLGWWAAEKFDGVRAYWDGAALWTRSGNEIVCPLTADLPKGMPLDGELWAGYGQFSKVSNLVRNGGSDWSAVRYLVFDAPSAAGAWRERLAAAEGAAPELSCVEAREIKTYRQFWEFYKEVLCRGGEGLVLRSATELGYRPGRASSFLKVKGGVLDYVRRKDKTIMGKKI